MRFNKGILLKYTLTIDNTKTMLLSHAFLGSNLHLLIILSFELI